MVVGGFINNKSVSKVCKAEEFKSEVLAFGNIAEGSRASII